MICLNITSMKNFLSVVNSCSGAVNLLYQDGRKINIDKQYDIQEQLQQEYQVNNSLLRLSLDIPDARDYMAVVCRFVGDF